MPRKLAPLVAVLLLLLTGCGRALPQVPPVTPAAPAAGVARTGVNAANRPTTDVAWVQRIPAAAYTIELARWGIPSNGTDATATTSGIQAAVDWAGRHGIGVVRLPAGTYLVGRPKTTDYLEGIVLPSNMVFEMSPKAVLKVVPNDRWNYCAIVLPTRTNVVIRGGTIAGDRATHTYTPRNGSTAHDEGHGICVWGLSRDVLIEQTRTTQMTGDGVLLLGGSTAGEFVRNITVRRLESDTNRRQGIAVVRGDGVLIEDCSIHHISGVQPQFGIDLETPVGKGNSRNILIRSSWFSDNRGGHIANFDARNAWVESNTMTQSPGVPQLDGPVIIHQNVDMTVVDNRITMNEKTANGLVGIMAYSSGAAVTTTATTYVHGNTCTRCGLQLRDLGPLDIRGNTFSTGFVALANVTVQLHSNAVTQTSRPGYSFSQVTGAASGNTLNGAPKPIPLSSTPYTADWLG